MRIVTKDSESKLLEIADRIKNEPANCYALHFNLSMLNEQYRSQYQIKLALNILKGIFNNQDSIAFAMADSDIIFIYNGTKRALLENAIFQLRYIFMDDPLCYSKDGSENDDLYNFYDLEFQWRDFFLACKKKTTPEIKLIAQNNDLSSADTPDFKLSKLINILFDIQKKDVLEALRIQPVCAITKNKDPKTLWSEAYINIQHLSQLLNIDPDVLSSTTIFKNVTKSLDKKILANLEEQISKDEKMPISLNLNLDTLLSNEFLSFDNKLAPNKKSSTIIEIQIADVFENLPKFIIVKESIHKLGYMLCLDGLDLNAFLQVNRKNLGFDLVKIQWREETATNDNKQIIIDAVQKCDPKRIILCHCDSEEAIEYGKSIGISLFQGRYIDKLIFPDIKLIN